MKNASGKYRYLHFHSVFCCFSQKYHIAASQYGGQNYTHRKTINLKQSEIYVLYQRFFVSDALLCSIVTKKHGTQLYIFFK